MTQPDLSSTLARAAISLTDKPELKEVPVDRMESKLSDTLTGFGVAVFGAALTAVGIWLFDKRDNPWLLVFSGGGCFLVLVGGINMSKDLAGSFKRAAETLTAIIKAWKGTA